MNHSQTHRLDRFVSKKTGINRREVRLLVAQQRINVNNQAAVSISQVIGQFDHIVLDQHTLQQQTPIYLMMHKPKGVISATSDPNHTTVIDLLDPPLNGLHLVGRLDKNTSGLLLLTNDGAWSKQLTAPENKVPKRYQVTTANPITADYAPAFSAGMYFGYEDITTQPVTLKITSTTQAEVTLTEGKYHQIKRMFGRFRNPVLELHRVAIGALELPADLHAGAYRPLAQDELLQLQNMNPEG